jgi:histidinol-phosphate/aromatic aminotransferase/cobyric acid decarboxylase-like protein
VLQGQLEQRRILVRDCRSFVGLDGHWLRLALLDRGRNQSLLAALPGALALTSSDR